MSKHHQMNEDQFPESQEELVRLKARAERYLDYAMDKNKGKKKAKITSLAIMISLERVKAAHAAVDEFQRKHKYRSMSRLDHLKAVFSKGSIYK